MKTSKSLFKLAADKYTSMSSELKETRKAFLEDISTPISAADLNKSYSNKQVKANNVQIPQPQFSNPENTNTTSNPGGKEKPVQQVPPTNPAANQNQSTQQTPIDLTNPNLQITELPDGSKLYVDPKNPTQGFIQPKDTTNLAAPIKEDTTIPVYTTEDIMSALSVLGGGSNSEALSAPDLSEEDKEGTVSVKPAGDVLVDEEDDDNSTDGMTDTSSENSEVSENDDPDSVDQSGELRTSGNETNPVKVGGKTDSTWSGINGQKSPEVEGEKTEKEIIPDNKTGVDSSYTTEKGSTEKTNLETDIQSEENNEEDTNPSGKESAFWVPNDDILGLKDIVGTVAKNNGVPNAQETIGKDASGNLVKKPTTPKHSTPNMRQYVKTNGVPGAPSVIPQGGQPVDISDLDNVIGMDTTNDRALNISLNFNF